MNPRNKIVDLDELARIVADCRKRGQKVVHCHGVFDLLHPGHVRHFEEARRQGDVLVVTLTADEHVNKGPGRPVFNQRLRAEWIAALETIDYVAVNRWPSAVETIELLRPDVFAKGSEFSDRDVDVTGNISAEEKAVEGIGGRLHLTDDVTFSSSQLLNAYFSNLPSETDAYLAAFRKRHRAEDVISRLESLGELRVAVVGDAIVDEYHFCKPFGMASKSSAVNARYLSSETHAGGALAAANHMAGFARHVHLVTCLGEETSQQDVITSRLKPNISTKFFLRPGAPTTVKRRFVSPILYQQLFEISFLDDMPLAPELEQTVAGYLSDVLDDFDVVLVADFGHGFLGPRLIEVLCRGKFFLGLNTQTNSANAGYNLATKYPRADYLCLDEEEIRLACHDRFGELGTLAEAMARRLGTSVTAVTQGRRGSLVLKEGEPPAHAPVVSGRVTDTVGAGDAYLALTTLAAAAGHPPDLLAFVGNCAGALLAQELGNRASLDQVPLYRLITALLK